MPDTPDFVELRVDGAALVVTTRGSSARSVRATLEDLLACVQAAERAARPPAGPK